MTGEAFHSAAADFPDPFRLLVRNEVNSTNDELHALARNGAPAGLVMLALRQTAGRGRRGAQWHSTPGETLAFSILVRPEQPKSHWPRLALAAGLAVAEALEQFAPATGIKWPNDIWIGPRKVAGILVEAGQDFAVVGIGINVNNTDFPVEISETATSLHLETRLIHSPEEVLQAVVRRFAVRGSCIGGTFEHVLDGVRQRCVLTGHTVSLTTSSGPRRGVVEGIAPGGELLLRGASGCECLMQADDVRILG
jgi:BirA family biotin operon repressor/biotin-[acetyl-CoA-carboxylase] ligase